MLDAEDDITSDIQAAFDSAASAEPAEAPAEAAAPEAAEPPAPEANDGRARDAQGKFIAKDPANDAAPAAPAPVPTAEQPPAEQPQPDQAGADFTVPPRSLKAEAKAEFATWPALARQEIIRRDVEMTREAQRLRGEADRWQPVEAVLAPHRQQFQMLGLNDAQVVQKLVAAHQYLERDPTAAIEALRRQYGGAQQQPSEPGQEAPQGDPRYQQLEQKFSALEQRLHAQDQSAAQREQSQILSDIYAFADAKDEQGQPKHLYFDDVKEEMAALMDAERADTLEAAYDMAIWGRPDIRKLVLAKERAAQDQDQRQRQTQHAQQARAAGVSITGAVPTGAKPPNGVDPNSSLEDDIRNAMQAVGGRV